MCPRLLVLAGIALALAGCSGSSSAAGRTSYAPNSGGDKSAYAAYRASRGTSTPPTAESPRPLPVPAEPAAPPASAARVAPVVRPAVSPAVAPVREDEPRREARRPSGLADAAGAEEAVGPVFEAGDGKKYVQLAPDGWQCTSCQKTYTVSGHCCGRPLRKTD